MFWKERPHVYKKGYLHGSGDVRSTVSGAEWRERDREIERERKREIERERFITLSGPLMPR